MVSSSSIGVFDCDDEISRIRASRARTDGKCSTSTVWLARPWTLATTRQCVPSEDTRS